MLQDNLDNIGRVIISTVPIIMHVVLYSIIGTENERYFLQCTPYLVVFGGYLLFRYNALAPGTLARIRSYFPVWSPPAP